MSTVLIKVFRYSNEPSLFLLLYFTECDASRYGEDCDSSCNCHGNCNKISGECDGDCIAGWVGNPCQYGS